VDIWRLRLDKEDYNIGYGDALRDEVHNDNITPLIGIFDMYSASVAAQHYGGMFVSGFGFAASYYGLPDIGFIAWPDMVGFVQRLRLAFPQQHLLVDIDDGYVDPEVACHVVEHLERIGASGVILEEQTRPRRCGHITGKQIVPIEEPTFCWSTVCVAWNGYARCAGWLAASRCCSTRSRAASHPDCR
jgi:2-methylisocitrate lyase-like PEP mutase family enzyme